MGKPIVWFPLDEMFTPKIVSKLQILYKNFLPIFKFKFEESSKLSKVKSCDKENFMHFRGHIAIYVYQNQ